jgi:hypothetical protein
LVDDYRVPKIEIPAAIRMLGGPPLSLRLFLAAQAETHSGYERPSDLLNAPDAFLPALDGEGHGLIIIRRDALVVVSVPASHEWGTGTGEEAATNSPPGCRIPVEVTLHDGTALAGEVAYAMPEGRSRLIDFLNTLGRFLPLRDGETLHFINKEWIVSVRS